ncbi:MAG TPA: hypothetical protein VMQ93_05430 [Novosphingobium sp.]|nr:hypothetical protein [Novosphingobium sp.]
MEHGLDAAEGHPQYATISPAGLALLFAEGERPSPQTIVDVVEEARRSGLLARVSHRPEPDAGWLELLASGLTFDLLGLAPAEAAAPVAVYQSFGFEGDAAAASATAAALEAIELVPSGHIAAGAGLDPVLRIMMGLAANIALHLPVAAVSWRPAQTLMEPRYFSRIVLNWLGGGAFPALGLTALMRAADGSLATRGLAHFTGQEMQLEGREGEAPGETIKLAIRVIDHLVRVGRITETERAGAGPDTLLFEPSQVGKLVLVWRGD